jgi:hypothetical protein
MKELNLDLEDWSNVQSEHTDSPLDWAPASISNVLNSLEPQQFPDEFENEGLSGGTHPWGRHRLSRYS